MNAALNWGLLSQGIFLSLPPGGEGGWPSGQTDEGTIFAPLCLDKSGRAGPAPPLLSGFFLEMRRGFRPAGRVSFPAMGKKPKDRRGTAPDEHFVLIVAFPPGPHYGGRIPIRFYNISGAQNLSGFLRLHPGHWALGLQKLPLVRFHFCAWLGRTGDSWSVIAGRSGTGPTKWGMASVFAVGAGP